MSFVPLLQTSDPVLQTFNLRRARALAAGILWRARKAGRDGNSLSIQTRQGKFIVCHYSAHRSEVVQGAEATYLKHTLTAHEAVVLDTATKTARLCEVDFITGDYVPVQDLGTFTYGPLIFLGSKVIVQLTEPDVQPAQIIIRPIVDVYDLQPAVGGWDTAALQAQLIDSAVELCTTAVVDAPAPPAVITEFTEVRLSGGSGLPLTPHEIYTGPTVAQAVLNYVELEDGSVAAVARLHVWVGESASSGRWEPVDETPIFYDVPTE